MKTFFIILGGIAVVGGAVYLWLKKSGKLPSFGGGLQPKKGQTSGSGNVQAGLMPRGSSGGPDRSRPETSRPGLDGTPDAGNSDLVEWFLPNTGSNAGIARDTAESLDLPSPPRFWRGDTAIDLGATLGE
jgi:hypothetical protein